MNATTKSPDKRTYAEKMKACALLKTKVMRLLRAKKAPMSLDEMVGALRSKKSDICYKGDVRYAVLLLMDSGRLRLNKDNDVVIAE
jgi:hypothetical protein